MVINNINAESIIAEAQKAAWLYDDIKAACPYPWGSLAAEIFKNAFASAQEDAAGVAAQKGQAHATA